MSGMFCTFNTHTSLHTHLTPHTPHSTHTSLHTPHSTHLTPHTPHSTHTSLHTHLTPHTHAHTYIAFKKRRERSGSNQMGSFGGSGELATLQHQLQEMKDKVGTRYGEPLVAKRRLEILHMCTYKSYSWHWLVITAFHWRMADPFSACR